MARDDVRERIEQEDERIERIKELIAAEVERRKEEFVNTAVAAAVAAVNKQLDLTDTSEFKTRVRYEFEMMGRSLGRPNSRYGTPPPSK